MGALLEREAPVVLSVSADDSAEGGRVSFPLVFMRRPTILERFGSVFGSVEFSADSGCRETVDRWSAAQCHHQSNFTQMFFGFWLWY